MSELRGDLYPARGNLGRSQPMSVGCYDRAFGHREVGLFSSEDHRGKVPTELRERRVRDDAAALAARLNADG